MRYEDLCTTPDSTLQELFEFLHLDPAQATRDFQSVEHHILGNAMRLTDSSQITLDEKWRRALDQQDVAVFEKLAGDMNRRFGYE